MFFFNAIIKIIYLSPEREVNCLEPNENYEELKETTKSVLQMATSDNLYYALLLLGLMIILVKLVDLFFLPLKKTGKLLPLFIKACIKIMIVFTLGMRIISLIPVLQDFGSQILMSSSLIVVVVGFVFQEGLSNIVHGFILSVFTPFKIGDRISTTIDGVQVTGYVKEITARHTVLENVINSAHMIVPNSKMDTCVIGNNNFDMHIPISAFMDLMITYDSNVDKACEIMRSVIGRHPLVQQEREALKTTDPVTVMVSDFDYRGIALRGIVVTHTAEENFGACSDIRLEIYHRFNQEPDIEFAAYKGSDPLRFT